MQKRRERKMRSRAGAMGTVLMVMLIPATIMVGSLALETAHMNAVRTELQNATDAGALSGAQDLWLNADHAANNAYVTTARNFADGRAVSNSSPDTIVQVKVTRPTAAAPGQVEVSAKARVWHIWAPIFGRNSDDVEVLSVAGTQGKAWTVFNNQPFPIAVSLDTVPTIRGVRGYPVSHFNIGDTLILTIKKEEMRNCCFTSFTFASANANYLNQAIDQRLGLQPTVPGFIPTLKVGDEIHLNNGVMGEKRLAQSPYFDALVDKRRPPLILPLILGDPSFNQKRKVVGFIGFRVQDVLRDGNQVLGLSGTLEPVQIAGVSGPIALTGDPINDAALAEITLGPVQLIH